MVTISSRVLSRAVAPYSAKKQASSRLDFPLPLSP